MAMSPEALEVMGHLQECKRTREAEILRGAVAGEGIALAVAYKAAVAEVRLINGIMEKFEKAYARKDEADQADSGMTEMKD